MFLCNYYMTTCGLFYSVAYVIEITLFFFILVRPKKKKNYCKDSSLHGMFLVALLSKQKKKKTIYYNEDGFWVDFEQVVEER